jgi:hypothetical protein
MTVTQINRYITPSIAAVLLATVPAHAVTATIKCDAKGSPTETYVYGSADDDLLAAVKGAVEKAEKDWAKSGGCYSITITPKLSPMFGCNTKWCPPRRR